MTKQGKVLFIVHDNYQDDNVFPLGAAYLVAALREKGAEVDAYCMDVFHYSNEDLAEYLSQNEFDLIGLGFMAPRFKRTVEGLCKVINENKKNAWLVLGGHGPTPIPEYMLKTTGADAVIVGEGELIITDLLECKLTAPNRITDITGVASSVDGKYIVNERRKPIMDLDSISFPAWDAFPMDKYTASLKYTGMKEGDKSLAMITTRGCVNKCSFCHRMEKGIRARSVNNIIDEIKILNKTYGVNYFFFADELSIISEKKILEFTDAIKTNKLDIMYRMDCRVDLFNEKIAKALKDSGCLFLNIGFESTDQWVLDSMNKNVTVEQNIRAAEIANKYGIGVGLNLIWGLPGDNEKTLRRNAEFIKRYNLYDYVRTIRPVTPFPGSPLYYDALEKGLLKGPDDFFDRFRNTDLYVVNFMGMPEKDIYQALYEVNKDLILDHFQHTNNDMDTANELIEGFYNLYFKNEFAFRGARRLNTNEGMREKNEIV